jgi:hypothetical protein
LNPHRLRNRAFESAADEGGDAGGNTLNGAPGPKNDLYICFGNAAHSHLK